MFFVFAKVKNHVFQRVCTYIKGKNTFLKLFSFSQENGGFKLMNSVMMKIKNVKLMVADLATSKTGIVTRAFLPDFETNSTTYK